MTHRVVIVTGDRHAKAEEWAPLVADVLFGVWDGTERAVLIEGGAEGIDRIASSIWGNCYGHNRIRTFNAPWDECHQVYGIRSAAGPLRNHLMLAELLFWQDKGYDAAVLAFHNNLYGGSRGTRNMVTIAKTAGVRVRHFTTK